MMDDDAVLVIPGKERLTVSVPMESKASPGSLVIKVDICRC